MGSETDLAGKLDALSAQVGLLVEHQRRRDELFDEMVPILKEGMGVATERLQSLEEKGYFGFARRLVDVLDQVVEGYTEDDVEELALSIVGILDTVRAMTQPHILKVASEASEAASKVDEMDPVGVVGMVKASRDQEVQRGMAVMLEVLRKLGQGAEKASRKERLQAQLASRLQKATAPAARVRRPAPSPSAAPPSEAAQPPPVPGDSVVVLEGIEFTADGFLVDVHAWNEELANNVATSIGVTMTEAHWTLIKFAREEFEKSGASPNIRRLTKCAGITTKEIYRMFPKAPGKCTAMIAGLPKPVGCI